MKTRKRERIVLSGSFKDSQKYTLFLNQSANGDVVNLLYKKIRGDLSE